MTTRKKRAAATEPPAVTADNLAEFIGFDGDKVRLSQAIEMASAAVATELGLEQLPGNLSHPQAQAVKLLATRLLLTDEIEEPPTGDAIPLVVRYYLKVAASAQG